MKNFLILTLIVLVSSCTSKYKYQIKDERGNYYFCNFYEKTNDGCVMFNDKPGYDNMPGYPTRLCPPYKIKNLK
jgi:hypothetical protein